MENRVPSRQLSGEAIAQLRVGIDLLLSRWTALQMAVQNEWGGRDSRQKSDQLPLDILSRLTQTKEPIYIEDLEDILDEFMLSLNTEIGDGSIEEKKLMVMHEECLEGNFISIERLKEAGYARVAVPHIRQDVNDAEDDSDSSSQEEDLMDTVVDISESPRNLSQNDMVVDEPRPSAATEEDGWTVVAPRRGRRN